MYQSIHRVTEIVVVDADVLPETGSYLRKIIIHSKTIAGEPQEIEISLFASTPEELELS